MTELDRVLTHAFRCLDNEKTGEVEHILCSTFYNTVWNTLPFESRSDLTLRDFAEDDLQTTSLGDFHKQFLMTFQHPTLDNSAQLVTTVNRVLVACGYSAAPSASDAVQPSGPVGDDPPEQSGSPQLELPSTTQFEDVKERSAPTSTSKNVHSSPGTAMRSDLVEKAQLLHYGVDFQWLRDRQGGGGGVQFHAVRFEYRPTVRSGRFILRDAGSFEVLETLVIENVTDVIKGKITPKLQSVYVRDVDASRCAALLVDGHREPFELVAKSAEHLDQWVQSILALISKYGGDVVVSSEPVEIKQRAPREPLPEAPPSTQLAPPTKPVTDVNDIRATLRRAIDVSGPEFSHLSNEEREVLAEASSKAALDALNEMRSKRTAPVISSEGDEDEQKRLLAAQLEAQRLQDLREREKEYIRQRVAEAQQAELEKSVARIKQAAAEATEEARKDLALQRGRVVSDAGETAERSVAPPQEEAGDSSGDLPDSTPDNIPDNGSVFESKEELPPPEPEQWVADSPKLLWPLEESFFIHYPAVPPAKNGVSSPTPPPQQIMLFLSDVKRQSGSSSKGSSGRRAFTAPVAITVSSGDFFPYESSGELSGPREYQVVVNFVDEHLDPLLSEGQALRTHSGCMAKAGAVTFTGGDFDLDSSEGRHAGVLTETVCSLMAGITLDVWDVTGGRMVGRVHLPCDPLQQQPKLYEAAAAVLPAFSSNVSGPAGKLLLSVLYGPVSFSRTSDEEKQALEPSHLAWCSASVVSNGVIPSEVVSDGCALPLNCVQSVSLLHAKSAPSYLLAHPQVALPQCVQIEGQAGWPSLLVQASSIEVAQELYRYVRWRSCGGMAPSLLPAPPHQFMGEIVQNPEQVLSNQELVNSALEYIKRGVVASKWFVTPSGRAKRTPVYICYDPAVGQPEDSGALIWGELTGGQQTVPPHRAGEPPAGANVLPLSSLLDIQLQHEHPLFKNTFAGVSTVPLHCISLVYKDAENQGQQGGLCLQASDELAVYWLTAGLGCLMISQGRAPQVDEGKLSSAELIRLRGYGRLTRTEGTYDNPEDLLAMMLEGQVFTHYEEVTDPTGSGGPGRITKHKIHMFYRAPSQDPTLRGKYGPSGALFASEPGEMQESVQARLYLHEILDVFTGPARSIFKDPAAQVSNLNNCMSLHGSDVQIHLEASLDHQVDAWVQGINYILTYGSNALFNKSVDLVVAARNLAPLGAAVGDTEGKELCDPIVSVNDTDSGKLLGVTEFATQTNQPDFEKPVTLKYGGVGQTVLLSVFDRKGKPAPSLSDLIGQAEVSYDRLFAADKPVHVPLRFLDNGLTTMAPQDRVVRDQFLSKTNSHLVVSVRANTSAVPASDDGKEGAQVYDKAPFVYRDVHFACKGVVSASGGEEPPIPYVEVVDVHSGECFGRTESVVSGNVHYDTPVRIKDYFSGGSENKLARGQELRLVIYDNAATSTAGPGKSGMVGDLIIRVQSLVESCAPDVAGDDVVPFKGPLRNAGNLGVDAMLVRNKAALAMNVSAPVSHNVVDGAIARLSRVLNAEQAPASSSTVPAVTTTAVSAHTPAHSRFEVPASPSKSTTTKTAGVDQVADSNAASQLPTVDTSEEALAAGPSGITEGRETPANAAGVVTAVSTHAPPPLLPLEEEEPENEGKDGGNRVVEMEVGDESAQVTALRAGEDGGPVCEQLRDVAVAVSGLPAQWDGEPLQNIFVECHDQKTQSLLGVSETLRAPTGASQTFFQVPFRVSELLQVYLRKQLKLSLYNIESEPDSSLSEEEQQAYRNREKQAIGSVVVSLRQVVTQSGAETQSGTAWLPIAMRNTRNSRHDAILRRANTRFLLVSSGPLTVCSTCGRVEDNVQRATCQQCDSPLVRKHIEYRINSPQAAAARPAPDTLAEPSSEQKDSSNPSPSPSVGSELTQDSTRANSKKAQLIKWAEGLDLGDAKDLCVTATQRNVDVLSLPITDGERQRFVKLKMLVDSMGNYLQPAEFVESWAAQRPVDYDASQVHFQTVSVCFRFDREGLALFWCSTDDVDIIRYPSKVQSFRYLTNVVTFGVNFPSGIPGLRRGFVLYDQNHGIVFSPSNSAWLEAFKHYLMRMVGKQEETLDYLATLPQDQQQPATTGGYNSNNAPVNGVPVLPTGPSRSVAPAVDAVGSSSVQVDPQPVAVTPAQPGPSRQQLTRTADPGMFVKTTTETPIQVIQFYVNRRGHHEQQPVLLWANPATRSIFYVPTSQRDETNAKVTLPRVSQIVRQSQSAEFKCPQARNFPRKGRVTFKCKNPPMVLSVASHQGASLYKWVQSFEQAVRDHKRRAAINQTAMLPETKTSTHTPGAHRSEEDSVLAAARRHVAKRIRKRDGSLLLGGVECDRYFRDAKTGEVTEERVFLFHPENSANFYWCAPYDLAKKQVRRSADAVIRDISEFAMGKNTPVLQDPQCALIPEGRCLWVSNGAGEVLCVDLLSEQVANQYYGEIHAEFQRFRGGVETPVVVPGQSTRALLNQQQPQPQPQPQPQSVSRQPAPQPQQEYGQSSTYGVPANNPSPRQQQGSSGNDFVQTMQGRWFPTRLYLREAYGPDWFKLRESTSQQGLYCKIMLLNEAGLNVATRQPGGFLSDFSTLNLPADSNDYECVWPDQVGFVDFRKALSTRVVKKWRLLVMQFYFSPGNFFVGQSSVDITELRPGPDGSKCVTEVRNLWAQGPNNERLKSGTVKVEFLLGAVKQTRSKDGSYRDTLRMTRQEAIPANMLPSGSDQKQQQQQQQEPSPYPQPSPQPAPQPQTQPEQPQSTLPMQPARMVQPTEQVAPQPQTQPEPEPEPQQQPEPEPQQQPEPEPQQQQPETVPEVTSPEQPVQPETKQEPAKTSKIMEPILVHRYMQRNDTDQFVRVPYILAYSYFPKPFGGFLLYNEGEVVFTPKEQPPAEKVARGFPLTRLRRCEVGHRRAAFTAVEDIQPDTQCVMLQFVYPKGRSGRETQPEEREMLVDLQSEEDVAQLTDFLAYAQRSMMDARKRRQRKQQQQQQQQQ